MRNFTILILINICTILMLLASIALAVLSVVWGYSGFRQMNGKASVLTLEDGCKQQYYIVRYNQALGTGFKVYFLITVFSCCASGLLLLLTSCRIKHCQKGRNRHQEQTRIQQLSSRYYDKNNSTERYYPNILQITCLYVLISLLILSFSVLFNFYLQLILQSRKPICKIFIQESQVIKLAAVSFGLLITSILCFLFLLVLCFKFKKRMELKDLDNGSESYRQQVNKIMKQVPQSERNVIRDQLEDLIKNNLEQPQLPQLKLEQEQGGSIRIEQVPKVQSYIYKADQQELMVQSVYIRK